MGSARPTAAALACGGLVFSVAFRKEEGDRGGQKVLVLKPMRSFLAAGVLAVWRSLTSPARPAGAGEMQSMAPDGPAKGSPPSAATAHCRLPLAVVGIVSSEDPLLTQFPGFP